MRPAVAALLVVLPLLAAPPAGAVYQSPQVQALNTLRGASAVPVGLAVQGGGFRTLRFDVSVGGATPAQRAQSFLRSYARLFTEDDPDLTLELMRNDGGAAGEDVTVFVQKVRGVPVFGARLVIGSQPAAAGGPVSRVLFTSSNVLPAVQLETRPTLPASSAEDIARLQLGAFGAPTLGKTSLFVYDPRAFGQSGDPHLVWSVGLFGDGSVRPPKRVLVDAADGEIVLAYDLEYEGAGLSDFDLEIRDANGLTNTSNTCLQDRDGTDFAANESGVAGGYSGDDDVTTAWGAIRQTYLFYHDTFGRHSFDDDDALVRLFNHAGVGNASWSPGCDIIQMKDDWVGQNTLTHEFTHGVIDHSPSDLVYSNQSGALNESYADVMGAIQDTDWLHSEDRIDGGGALRSLQDPPGKDCGPPNNLQFCGDPDRMSQYVNTSGDNGGVHTNSGIPNKAHYLMAQGGSFNGLTISGIGRTKTGYIAYYTMRYLTSGATFSDARNLEISAGQIFQSLNLFGITSANICSIQNAWAAVEIGAPDANCDGVSEGVTDSDNDGVPNSQDNCDFAANPDQKDWNQDGTGDVCDPAGDDDEDGLPNAIDKCPHNASQNNYDSDSDGVGDLCDNDDDNDGVADNVDNCQYDYNPSQFDGNSNGEGDACDPDQDGDGLYVEDDNCTFVFNPGQQDADSDGMGDACDKCPNVSDNMQAYTNPIFGDPQPYQPDSDEDGIPDACDNNAFDRVGVTVDTGLFNPTQPVKPDGSSRRTIVNGPEGGTAKIPIQPCDPLDPDGVAKNERVELVLASLDDHVRARVIDSDGKDLGQVRLGTAGAGPPPKGVRFKPHCGLDHFLAIELLPGFPGSDTFTLLPRIVDGSGPNPWTLGDPTVLPQPPGPPDADRDGLTDAIDTCPAVANPENFDHDGDGKGDACDNCPSSRTPTSSTAAASARARRRTAAATPASVAT